MIDVLNELSRNQWIILYLAAAIILAIVLLVIMALVHDHDAGLSTRVEPFRWGATIGGSLLAGFISALILLGLTWAVAGIADWVAWMWSN